MGAKKADRTKAARLKVARLGGAARAATLSPERRREIASQGGKAANKRTRRDGR